MRTPPGQLELNFQFDRAELTADRLTTYRQVCKQVGREMGAFPCFMPKPFMGVSANGCHHNISLWDAEGNNKFMPEGDNPQLPGPVGMKAIGGILEHVRGLTCLSAPTVQLLPEAVGHRLLGARLRRLGASRIARPPCGSARRVASSTERPTARSTRTCPSRGS